jgi:hypothetical protein
VQWVKLIGVCGGKVLVQVEVPMVLRRGPFWFGLVASGTTQRAYGGKYFILCHTLVIFIYFYIENTRTSPWYSTRQS